MLETFTPRLSRLTDVGLELIADLARTTPDGVALCADGSFVVACYYPFRLLTVPADGGAPAVLLDDPVGIHIPMPTNVTFYGDGLDRLAMNRHGIADMRSLMAADVRFLDQFPGGR